MKNSDFSRSIVRRGDDIPKDRLKKTKRGLLTLHRFEIMAVNIYQHQISRKRAEIDNDLIAAMKNEMGHVQDFQVKLFEYGYRPDVLGWRNWIIGWLFGWSSRIIGRKAVLKMGIWTEARAIRHYYKILDEVEWETDTRKIIEKDLNDEFNHLNHWKAVLKRIWIK